MTRTRRTLAALTATLAALALTGCTGRSEVALTIRSEQAAEVTVAVELTGDAAAVTAGDADTLAELVATVESRTGTTASVERSPERVRVQAATDYEQLRASAGVTGVEQLYLSEAGDGVQAEIALSGAPELLEAMSQAVADQPDADALARTLTESTVLVLTVRFPGGLNQGWTVDGVDPSSVSATATTLTVVRPAGDAGPGLVRAVGDPDEPVNFPLLVGGALVILVAGAAAWARRRDKQELATR